MKKVFIMEKRDANGKLDFSYPQPPFLECTEEQITSYYFRHCGHDRPSAGLDEIASWYKERGFSWREKTW